MRTARRLAALLTLLLSAGPGAGQAARSAADTTTHDFRQRLLQALDLTVDQRDSLRAWRGHLEAQLERLRSQMAAGELPPAQGRRRYGALLETYRAARDSLLTPPQRQLLVRAWTYQHERSLRGGRVSSEAPESLVEALRLTAPQRDRWLALLARLREQVRLKEDAGDAVTSLDLRRLREEYVLAFETLLTPDQLLELERIRQARAAAATADADLQPGFDLLEDEASPGSADEAWKRLESDLGEDGAQP